MTSEYDKTKNTTDDNKFTWISGGVSAPSGILASGIHAGFRKNVNRKDLALVAADDHCAAAGVFTQNVFCAAPVQ